MARPKPGSEANREEISRLRAEAARLREEIGSLRDEADRTKEAAVVSDAEPAVRMALLREANE